MRSVFAPYLKTASMQSYFPLRTEPSKPRIRRPAVYSERSVEEICAIGGFGLVDAADSRLQSLLEERERTGRFRGELFYKRQDGSTFLGEVSSAFYQDHSGATKAAVIIRDVTDRKRIEETLGTSPRERRGARAMNSFARW